MDTSNKNETPSLNRRSFLKTTSGLAAVTTSSILMPSLAFANNDDNYDELAAHSHNADERFWRKVRREFVLNKRTTYMNVGTSGSIPQKVINNYHRHNEIISRNPWDTKIPTINLAKSIAQSFGAAEHELILSRNTTDGLCSILNGLNFNEGDVIITTNHEHKAVAVPLKTIAQRHRVQIVIFELPVYSQDDDISEDDFIEAFNDAVEEYQGRVRLMIFSHITYTTGTRLPVKRICQEVAIPNRIPTMIDGAHAPGMLNLDFHDLDCDFYAGAGHKWQCGPGATGILYVRDNASRLQAFWSDRQPAMWIVNSSSMVADLQDQLQYVGQDNYPAKQALTECCNMWDAIGRDVIESRILDLSELCKKQLQKYFPDAECYCPNNRSLSSGITTFNPFEDTHDLELLSLFRNRLHEEYGYIVRTTSFFIEMDDDLKANPAHFMSVDDNLKTHSIRISTHLFHNEKEVKGLVRAMKDLYRDMV